MDSINYEYVSGDDYFQKFNTNFVSNVDLDIILKLYQPLIGYKSTILYLTLANFVESKKTKHEIIFNNMQITPGDFLISRRSLEACGLLKTYLKENKKEKIYTYVIYSPKSSKDFFDDLLFRNLFIKYVGQEEAKKIMSLFEFKLDVKKIQSLNDVTTKFNDVFNVNLDDKSFDIKLPLHLKDNQAIKVDTEFNFNKFFENLEKNMISKNALNQKDCVEIERIATLYGLDEHMMSDIISQIYDEHSVHHIDLNSLQKKATYYAKFSILNKKNKENKKFIRVSGKTILADKIRIMEKWSPKRFLQEKQHGIPPVTADLNLINYLSGVLQLNNSVINAIIEFALKRNDNRLDRNYVEKIASSIKRSNINTALDALNYLELPKKKNFNLKTTKNNNHNMKDKYDEHEYEKIIKSIEET